MTLANAFIPSNMTTQTFTAWQASQDSNSAAINWLGAWFQPTVTGTNMNVSVGPGASVTNGVLQSTQTVTITTAPTSNSRVDLVVINRQTAVASVITGTVAASPTTPICPVNYFPICTVTVAANVTTITAANVADARIPGGGGIPTLSAATQCLYVGPNMSATAYNYSTSFGDTNTLANAQCTIFGAGNSTGTSGGNAIFGNQSSVSSLGCLAVGSQNTVASPFGTAVGYNHNLIGTGPTLAFGVSCTSTANNHSLLMGYGGSTSVGNSIVIGRGAVNYTYSCAIGQNTGGARPWSGSSLSFSTTSPWNSSGPSSGQYAQSARILMTQQTSNATATELFTDGASGRVNVLNPPTNALLTCHGFVTAQSGTSCAVWEVKAAIQRAANGNVALVGTPTVTSLFTSGTVTGWAVALSADTTNQTLKFAVTGSATQTINWLARLEATELAM